MSKQQTVRAIRSELDRLNQEIDLRIIKGVSYRREARRHRFLTAELAHLVPRHTRWLMRSLSFMSTFMF